MQLTGSKQQGRVIKQKLLPEQQKGFQKVNSIIYTYLKLQHIQIFMCWAS